MKINVSFLAALLTMFGFCVVLGYFLRGDTIFPTRHGGAYRRA